MPLEIEVSLKDSTKTIYYIPLEIMWGEKQNEYTGINWIQEDDWQWVFPEYTLTIDEPKSRIQKIEIDPSQRMADINRENNMWQIISNDTETESP